MSIPNKSTILVTCAKGLVPYLVKEVEDLGYSIDSQHDTGLEITGNFYDTMRLNLNLRTAYNVLYLIKKFNCESAIELYKEIYALAWEKIIDPKEYISIVSWVNTRRVNNSLFASYKVKDAIVDRIREKTGKRPDSGPDRENIVINFYWQEDNCWLYINTSGRKLSDRGYRKLPHSAPLQETLAAAIVLATGYSGKEPLVLPMCGSGTLAIEAALIALDYPAGLLRKNFGFMHIKGYDQNLWHKALAEKTKHPKKLAPIIATDIDKEAIYAARQNAILAKVSDYIEFYTCDFASTQIPKQPGVIIINPGYGHRLGQIKDLEKTYTAIGDFFKQKCPGYRAYLFSGNMDLLKKVGLRSKQRLPFFNAQLECRLVYYPLWD